MAPLISALSSHVTGRNDLTVPQFKGPAQGASSILEPIAPNPGSDHFKSPARAKCPISYDQGQSHTHGCLEPGVVLRKGLDDPLEYPAFSPPKTSET